MNAHKTYLLTLVAALVLGSETEAWAQYSRRTPITEAVEKTRDSVLSLKVEKKDSRGRIVPSFGTAFLVDERGYAVTNCHVVSGAVRVYATLSDGTQIKARVLTEETPYDVALLKLETDKKFKAVTLGSSSDLIIGETVLAVGNAMGLSHSVSRGILSAAGRQLNIPGHAKVSEKGLLQTDAPINAGNSGGPLLNINGEVIGVTFAVRNEAQGVAFAIPIDTVKDILCRHLSARKLGGVEHELAYAEKVEPEGKAPVRVLVTRAAHAGFKPGDHITTVAGRTITNRFDVERALWECKPGQHVGVGLVREGKKIEVSLALTGEPELVIVQK